MESKPNKTLDDIEIPTDEDWEFEYETDRQAHWYRKDVPAEEIAEDSEVYTADDYREQMSDEHMTFSMTIRYDQSGWTVSFIAPSIRKGMGDVDNRYSMQAGSLEEALAHVQKIFDQKGPSD